MTNNLAPITTSDLRAKKHAGEPIAMITAYDFPSAKLVEEAGAEMILVGDSLGMVVLGYDSTLPVTMDDMLHHTKAVTRAAKRAFVVADLPFLSYHGTVEEGVKNAGRLLQEGLAKAVKMEGGTELVPLVKRCVQAGIPVMGHIGLTPQAVHQLGGYKVQGRDLEAARRLMDEAEALQEAGIFSLVLECVPEEVAALISAKLDIPVIGIGAGSSCDGQVLVFHDLVGYASQLQPKFVKRYADVGTSIRDAVRDYVSEVKERRFPAPEHVFHAKEEMVSKLYGGGGLRS
ncbi:MULTISPECIES: 3-methyl-2-oxobutanoate hydroxymethyltransferase [Brevibacillus]|jgi:3-methyl-2-oxobutanoate hydroxymethyltransferase|uniref:3-methyl-2-oxobutanoate hydroxymethyltransferase n=1 Tax=Brevibacillus borstelensis AK1 TaxID=1300222 RepID=M8DJF2_9BACL|nr:3-methyl-2-oxobutanoate hydroxymethyltransferase [Brevibacillus borstelensis]EMT53557.1 3-methyl-2-oxobutanoate hydroxymethyltransferase [Brevibacillus borstelensis AK1]KKX53060.1 3-methyl-2-oxobutanoate hydroxymethyltransferase [Brevibacillus borstelensis cifa_chp40]MBE5397835.1 3-methyl-2-oxobutanoate hydroxymethyltransferase [Brevibacillus borstelensis]MCC0562772.1 3-methyl-2-oxobutanoate hydroxymethyltransferase [Brevibacillus borstelensis]MCM3469451.1 3-methyl-2-oxobutanoate hydroxymet